MQTENVVNSLERQLDISIPMAMFEAEVDKRIQKLARNVKMDGFRPGKVPLKVVAQQYGFQVRQEVLGEVVQSGFSEAVRQQNLKVAGNPRIEGKPSPEGSQDLVFSAIFEIYPEVVVGDISAVAIDRPDVVVSDADIDKTIEILRKQRVTFNAVERAAATGDQVSIDYHGKTDGEDFKGGQAKGYKLVLGDGRALKDFEDAVVGMKVGESKKFDMTFPEDYHAKELAGKLVTFEITLNSVEEPVLPVVDADFAKTLGIDDGDLVKMREEIRKNVEREVKRRIRTKIKEQAMKTLVESSSLDLPNALIDMEIERLKGYAAEQMGLSPEKAAEMSMPREMFEEQAKERVRLGLVLAQVVQANQIKPSAEQVRALVDEHAETFEQPEEVVSWYYASPERLSEVESIALEDSVVNWVLEQAKVVDKTMSFDELMGNA